MNKFLTVMAGVSLALVSAASLATTPSVSGSVGVNSRYDYHGQKYSDDASLGGSLIVSDIGLKGLYVSGNFNKVGDTMPYNQQEQLRSDVGVGYVFSPLTDLTIDASANHVNNAPEFGGSDYSELRLNAAYKLLFVEVGQDVGRLKDTYAKVGVSVPVTDTIKVGAAVSGYHYNTPAVNRYNNSEVFVSYDVTKQLHVYGKYSFGGKTVADDVLVNYGTVGLSYSF